MQQYFFTEEHQLFRQTLRDFLEKEINSHIDEWEAQGEIPRWVWQKFGEMGYFGIMYPEQYGGLDLDFFYTVVFLEEIQRTCSGGFAASIGAHPFLALAHINEEGTEAQKEQYLKPGIAGEIFGCLGITEPFGGSDVAAIRTTATKKGNEYIINGSKTFITNGVLSDFLVIAARTTQEGGSSGISMFIIDRDTPGVSATKLDKLGWRASDTGEIAFNEVCIPAENLLGEENRGFYYIMARFALERLIMAVGGIAACDYAMEYTLQYMSERQAFGRPINKFQELRHRMAQLASEIEMNRVFNYHLCRRYQDGDYLALEAAMSKLLSTELSDKVMYQCLQMFGGYGYMEDYKMARLFRDSRLGTIGGGTSEIMREIISKMVIDTVAYQSS